MLRSIPFHPNMNLNLSFSIFTHPAMDASSTMSTLYRHLMRTAGTEFISEMSAATNSVFLFQLWALAVKITVVSHRELGN